MQQEPAETIRVVPDKIWKLLDKPEKWTQQVQARLPNGQACLAEDPEGVCWCLESACWLVYRPDHATNSKNWCLALDKIRSKLGLLSIHIWNDAPETTYNEVIAVCKELDI